MPGIGDATARAMMDAMAGARLGSRRVHALRRRRHGARRAPRARRRCCGSSRGDEPRRRDAGRRSRATSPRFGCSTTPSCKERYDRPEPRLADLDQLRTIAAGYPTRAAFLAALALEPPSSTQDLAGGIGERRRRARPQHGPQRQGKGVEGGVRHLGGGRLVPVVARRWTSDDELEEERRLMYVALTRATERAGGDLPDARSTARAAARTTRSISSRASSTAACARRCSASSSRKPRATSGGGAGTGRRRPARVHARPLHVILSEAKDPCAAEEEFALLGAQGSFVASLLRMTQRSLRTRLAFFERAQFGFALELRPVHAV